MALEDLTKRIEEDAATERERILERAKKEVENVRKAELELFAQSKEEKTAAMKREEERLRRSVRVTTSMKTRSYELSQRRELMDLVRERALSSLQQLDDAQYETFLTARLKEVDAAEGEVTPAKGRKVATEAAVKSAGKSFTVLAEDDALGGGFRFQSGALRIDASFEALLGEFFTERETDVAAKLFTSAQAE